MIFLNYFSTLSFFSSATGRQRLRRGGRGRYEESYSLSEGGRRADRSVMKEGGEFLVKHGQFKARFTAPDPAGLSGLLKISTNVKKCRQKNPFISICSLYIAP